MGPVPELDARAEACADRLRRADSVLLSSHIDADGLTSAAIAATALERAGIPFDAVFEKQLDEAAIREVAATDHETAFFTDFGSGQLDIIVEYDDAFTPVIADHHQPADAETEYHCNPLLEGLNGASELSGAGATYAVARALEPDGVDNRDLAGLAVVGAVGDMQGGSDGLTGANEGIVTEGIEAGVLAEGTDLAMYGRQTRPLPKLLQYASDVRIPGITGDESGTVSFLAELDADLREDGEKRRSSNNRTQSGDGEWKRWVDLADDDRRTVASALLKRAVASGVPAEGVNDLIGTTYTLTREEVGTELRDVSEFSTLLNATARYDRADVGLAVCLGDRGDALDRARTLLRNHRKNLSEGLDLVKSEGVTVEDNLQWFDAGTKVRETIVGIVAGMALGTDGVRADRPIVAFASAGEEPRSSEHDEDEAVKVSSRAPHTLVRQGLDLSAVMREAARSVGGDGGGHDVAAGATIPAGTRTAFVEAADDAVADQL
ncbi:DHH family phosphoesterase [Haloplanus salilacus]|uniref:DHH family phosphoesterase n=1 Tax=Haloplanus salilacus TaxID=2949994 RepID=UPI0030D5F0CD